MVWGLDPGDAVESSSKASTVPDNTAGLSSNMGTKKRKKVDTKILDDFHDPDCPTTEESEDERNGGAKIHPLLLEISKAYREMPEDAANRKDKKLKKRVRCAGSKGCKTTWKWPRSRARIFKHAQSCLYLGTDLKAQVIQENAKNATGPKAVVRLGRGRRIDTDSEEEVT